MSLDFLIKPRLLNHLNIGQVKQNKQHLPQNLNILNSPFQEQQKKTRQRSQTILHTSTNTNGPLQKTIIVVTIQLLFLRAATAECRLPA